jgi:integrase
MPSAHGLPSSHQKRPSIKLTAANVRTLTLPDGKSDYTFFDADVPGFGLRLRASGSRNWIFQYSIAGLTRRMQLGAASAITVADARKTASKLHARTKLAEDPANDKNEARLAVAETFGAILDQFLEYQRARLRPKSFRATETYLRKSAVSLHRMQLTKISRRDIAAVLTPITASGHGPTANRLRTEISSLFVWAMEQGFVEANPTLGTKWNEENSRSRVLSSAELRAIWAALGTDRFSGIIGLLMLTAQRKTEIGGLRWEEIHPDTIALPAERVKNGRAHIVPLSTPAREIINRHDHHDGRKFVFSRYHYGGPFSGWSMAKQDFDERIKEMTGAALPAWVIHDLRRTAATGMAELGVQPHVIECVLNHQSGFRAGVAGVYNKADYEPEKRRALDLWAEHLTAVAEGRESNVTPIRRGA